MSRSRALIFALLFLSSSVAVWAAPPMFSLLPFKRVEADAKKNYKLTKSQGPWMIMAISFAGDDADKQARDLVLELRRDHKLEAWMHEQEIELEKNLDGLGVDKYGNRKKMRYQTRSSPKEIAVVVGNYKTAEDPDGTRTLETIRCLKTKCLSQVKLAQQSGMQIRDAYRFVSDKAKGKVKQRGEMGRAFLTRNPMLPPDELAKQTLDPFVVDLNRGLAHSLLENPSRYTVVIATYRGAAGHSEKDFEASVRKGMDSDGDSPIDKAAKDAGLVAAQLRKEGWEAYVFHDRHESLVTVGAFDEVGQEMADGHVELQPKIAKVIKRFEPGKSSLDGAKRVTADGKSAEMAPTGQLALIPKTVQVSVDGKQRTIPLDVSPRLIMVPRQSIADVYRQDTPRR